VTGPRFGHGTGGFADHRLGDPAEQRAVPPLVRDASRTDDSTLVIAALGSSVGGPARRGQG